MKDKFNNAVGPQIHSKSNGRSKVIPVLAVTALVGGVQAATQYFAYEFGYQSVLGANLFHIYPPWSIVQWAGKWYGQYKDGFMRAGSIGIVVSTVGLLTLSVIQMVMANSSKANNYLHGSARWANVQDIRAAGLLSKPRNVWQWC